MRYLINKKILSFMFPLVVIAACIYLYSCTKDSPTSVSNQHQLGMTVSCLGGDTCAITYGSTHINAGTLIITNVEDSLILTYNITGCTLSGAAEDVKIWVGNDILDMPLSPGGPPGCPNPNQGAFPFKYTLTGTSFRIAIAYTSIADLNGIHPACGSNLIVVTHLDLNCNGGQTAWAGCTLINPNCSYGGQFYTASHNICCDSIPPPPPQSCYNNTAFAKFPKIADGLGQGYVWTTQPKANPENYPTLGMTQNRWGWAMYLTGLGTPATYTYPIWAGAGLNKTSNGTLVGTLTVVVNADKSLDVTYTASGSNLIADIHLLAELCVTYPPTKPASLAPGQFEFVSSYDPKVSTVTVHVDNPNGCNTGWLIAHSEICY